MDTQIPILIKQLNSKGIQYAEAFKNGLNILCNKLRLEMAKISEKLRKLGVAIGMTHENLAYLKNALKTSEKPETDTETRECVLRDLLGLFTAYDSLEKPFTYRGFEKYTVEPDGTLSLPEPAEAEPPPKLPPHPQHRAADLIQEVNQNGT